MEKKHSLLEILWTSLKLGFTSFGGPTAHLGFFKDEYVDRKKWLNDKLYADIIALCQFLPGPASSQVGIAIGMLRGGLAGGFLSWFGFTMPSVIVLIVFALMFQTYSLGDATFISSLKIVAVAIVANAILGMSKNLISDKPRIVIALASLSLLLIFPSAWMQIAIIIGAAIVGYLMFSENGSSKLQPVHIAITKRQGIFSLIILGILLIGLPIIVQLTTNTYVNIFDMFFRVGAIVFGGGHVVLPLLEQQVVPNGLLTSDEFLAGYGIANAVPGPLFTFASYIGTMISGIMGGIIATVAMFLPSFLLIIGVLPFLSELRNRPSFQGILAGVNASVVGILLAAFYDPVFTSGIHNGVDFALAAVLFAMLNIWKKPAWLIVIVGIVLGEIIHVIL